MKLKEDHLDTTKSWEERYKLLVDAQLNASKKMLENAPLRPAMYIGRLRDNRDAEFLMMSLIQEIHTIFALTGIDSEPFTLKWGVGARYHLRNISERRGPQENVARIKLWADDFLSWIKTGVLEDHSIEMKREIFLDENCWNNEILDAQVEAGKLVIIVAELRESHPFPTTYRNVPVVVKAIDA